MPRPARARRSRHLHATLAAEPVRFAHGFGPYHREKLCSDVHARHGLLLLGLGSFQLLLSSLWFCIDLHWQLMASFALFGWVVCACLRVLQGINGAGKTTTLKILSGDIIPTVGTAKLSGVPPFLLMSI